jgi:hypothetical protein
MESPYRRLVFVMIDGAPYAVLRDLVDRGDLPALAGLAEKGGGVKQAVTCFPSTTGPAYIPYFMGLFPGTANVPGYRWLSRAGYDGRGSRWTRPGVASYSGREAATFDHDLADRPTWFDYFASSRNVFNLLTKGLARKDDMTRYVKPPLYVIGHYLHAWELADRASAAALVRAVKQGPEFVACSFNGVDGHSHAAHPRAPRVIETYRLIDRTIGECLRGLRSQGRDEETLWVVGSDHGHTPTHTHIDVTRVLEGLGLMPLYYPRLWRRDAHAAEMVSGNGMTQLYFRNGRGWSQRTPWEEVDARGVPDALLAHEGVDLVCGRTAAGIVRVKTRRGEGDVDWRDGLCSYSYRGEDPLATGPFDSLTAEEVLRRSFDCPRPDAALQLAQLFRSERSGDLLVSAREGYDLRARWEFPEHRSTHGALVAGQMHVPVIFSHPVAADRFRTADVFPTVLGLLGREHEGEIDGVGRC